MGVSLAATAEAVPGAFRVHPISRGLGATAARLPGSPVRASGDRAQRQDG